MLTLAARKKVARAEVEAATLRVADAVLGLAYDVESAFYALQAANQVAAMRRTILETGDAALELAQRQHDAGNISELDLATQQTLCVRVRLGNLSMDSHPIHLHGHPFEVTGTDAGPIPASARFREVTTDVPVGATRDIELVADNPGDWAFHSHKSHHTMNAMSHDLPNVIGVDPGASDAKIQRVLPGYMTMGQTGMGHMMDMGRPKNTLAMMAGKGPFGPIEMGGMFTILKVREGLRARTTRTRAGTASRRARPPTGCERRGGQRRRASRLNGPAPKYATNSAPPSIETFFTNMIRCIAAIVESGTFQKACIIRVTGTRKRTRSHAPRRAW